MTHKEKLIDFFVSQIQNAKNRVEKSLDLIAESQHLLIETMTELRDLQDEVERRLKSD